MSNASTVQQMTPDTAKSKCKRLLSALLGLAKEQPARVGVRALVQGLVDGAVDPMVFAEKLRRLLPDRARRRALLVLEGPEEHMLLGGVVFFLNRTATQTQPVTAIHR